MKRYILAVLMMASVGLAIVTGQVDSVKTGYRIRELAKSKLELQYEVKTLEYRLVRLKTPGRLESWLTAYQVPLTRPKEMKIAAIQPSPDEEESPAIDFGGFLVGTAQAEADD